MMKAWKGWVAAGLSLCVGCVSAKGVSFEDLARHDQYRAAKLSPDGRHLAVVSVIEDKPVLSLIDIQTLKGVNVRPRDGDDVVDFEWVNDHRVLYTIGLKSAGFDQPFSTGEIFAVNADGGGATTLFGFRAQGSATGATHIQRASSEYASASLIDTLRDDDDHVLIGVDSWMSGAEGAFTKAYRMDVRDGTKVLLTTAPLRRARFMADRQGRLRFAYGSNSQAKAQVFYRADDAAGWSLLFTEDDHGGMPFPLAFSRDDSRVYMTCAAPGAVGAVCPWDVATRTMLAPAWTSATVTADGLLASLDGRDVDAVLSTPDYPAISPIVPHSDAVAVIGAITRQFPGHIAQVVSSSSDGSRAIVLVWSDEDPGTYYLWSRADGKVTALLQRDAWIHPDAMAVMQPVSFPSRDGTLLHGYLSMPPGKESGHHLPLVVFVHGGPFGVRDSWGYDPYVQAMATHGYAVLQVNFRGSGGYGSNFESAGYRQWGGTMQDDVTDATQWALKTRLTDAGRICIFGGSYGGYAALEGAVKEPDLYACAIGYVGVYDLNLMRERGDIPQSTQGANYLKEDLGDDPRILASHSPVNQLDQLKAKVMLVVGGEDHRVPPVQGQHLHQALLDRHVDHEWLYEPGEGHGFYAEKNRTELLRRVVVFLDRTIGDSASH